MIIILLSFTFILGIAFISYIKFQKRLLYIKIIEEQKSSVCLI